MEPRTKKILVISLIVLLVVGVAVAVIVGLKSMKKGKKPAGKKAPGKVATSKKAIDALCQSTSYKQTCESSLLKVAGNTTDPKEIVMAGLQVAADSVNQAIKNSSTLRGLAKDPMTSQALDVCREMLNTAVEDLLGAIDKMGPFDVAKIDDYLEDLKVWLSAAVNHQQTCVDAFKDTEAATGEKMKGYLKTAQEMTSNGLAMVAKISSLFGPLDFSSVKANIDNVASNNNRRLLEATSPTSKGGEEKSKRNYKAVPSWMSARKLDLMSATPERVKANVVVAKDGSGKYKTIKEALKEVPKKNNKTFIIYVKEGVYKEYITIEKHMTNVFMIGDGPTKTRITGNKNKADGTATMYTATFAAVGDYFIAKGIGFENTAGHIKHQAVALRVQSDFSIFFNCHMDAYQDTLYTQTYRQYYRDCTITGTVDFIFGDGVVLFQNCKMVVRKPGEAQSCMVTAQGRTDKNEITGIVLQNCTITGDDNYKAVKDENKAYLGRPWKPYARVIVMQSEIDDAIQPEGWTEWTGEKYHTTCFMGEYGNRGPSSDMSQRVKWKTIAKLTPKQAEAFTPANLLEGDKWIKPSGVPYNSGLFKSK